MPRTLIWHMLYEHPSQCVTRRPRDARPSDSPSNRTLSPTIFLTTRLVRQRCAWRIQQSRFTKAYNGLSRYNKYRPPLTKGPLTPWNGRAPSLTGVQRDHELGLSILMYGNFPPPPIGQQNFAALNRHVSIPAYKNLRRTLGETSATEIRRDP